MLSCRGVVLRSKSRGILAQDYTLILTHVTTYKLVQSYDEAEYLWKGISPEKTLHQSWDYRFLYTQLQGINPVFAVCLHGGRPVVLVPMQETQDSTSYEPFGGVKFCENEIFAAPGHEPRIRHTLELFDKPLIFRNMKYIVPGLVENTEPTEVFKLDLTEVRSMKEYLDRYWPGKHKKNLAACVRKIENQGYKIKKNDFGDLEIMRDLNVRRFGDRSHFMRPHRLEYLRRLGEVYDVRIFSLVLGGVAHAVSYSIFYNGVYYGLTSGVRTDIPNLRKYVNYLKIHEAIDLRAKYYDAGRKDFGWKIQFGFCPQLLYRS